MTSFRTSEVDSLSVALGVQRDTPHMVCIAQRIRRALYDFGIPCTMQATTHVGGCAWRDHTAKLIRQSGVFVPLIDSRWLATEECLLELYYALRSNLVNGKPFVLPVLFPDVLLRLEQPECRVAATLLRDCFHVEFVPPLAAVAAKIRNFTRQLGYEVKEVTVATGAALAEVYTNYFQKCGGKKPNSGVVNLLASLGSRREICLANNYIGDIGLRALCAVLDMRPDVQRLDLRGNGITNAAVHGLVDTLVTHPGITALDLSDNDLSHPSAVELLWLARRNQQLVELGVRNTSIKAVWQKRIQMRLRSNSQLAFADTNRDLVGQSQAYHDEMQFPVEPLPAPHRWTVRIDAATEGAAPVPTALDVQVALRAADGARAEYRFQLSEAADGRDELWECVRDYLALYDARTIAVNRHTKLTAKYVLEDAGEGTERLAVLARRRFALAGRVPESVDPDQGHHVVGVKLVVTPAGATDGSPRAAAPRSPTGAAAAGRAQPFFLEGTVLYHKGRRVGKRLVQLFRADIVRCQGSLEEEVEWLVEKLFREDMVEEEELDRIRQQQETDETDEAARQDRLMEDIVQIWKCSPAVLRREPDPTVAERFRKLRAYHEGMADEDRATLLSGSLPADLRVARTTYEIACKQEKNYPPYAY